MILPLYRYKTPAHKPDASVPYQTMRTESDAGVFAQTGVYFIAIMTFMAMIRDLENRPNENGTDTPAPFMFLVKWSETMFL